jgi:hypothetical protein
MIQPSFSASPGGAIFDTGLVGQSAWFDGTNDQLLQASVFGVNEESARFILSFWVRRHHFAVGATSPIIGTNEGGNLEIIRFDSDDKLRLQLNNQASITSRVFRDTAWYHILVSVEVGTGTGVNLYVNGELETLGTAPTLSGNPSWFNSTNKIQMAVDTSPVRGKLQLAQVCGLPQLSIQNGDYTVANFLDTFNFGANGSQYVPKSDAAIVAIADAVGGNAFCLTTAIGDGTDASANGNDFTPTSMSHAANGSDDTPSLVYPVLNILDRGDTGLATFKDGNEFTVSNAVAGFMRATMSADTGKFYYECAIDGLPSSNFEFGMQDTVALNTGDASVGNGFVLHIASSGAINLYEGGTAGASQETGVTDAAHTFQCAVDFDSGKFWFGRDDTWYGSGNPAAGTNETGTFTAGLRLAPVVGRDSSASTVAEQRLVWDSGSFNGTMPTGFLEWSSASLPTPAYQGVDSFNVALYTGDGVAVGSGGNAITGLGFQPGFVWVKNRVAADQHVLTDGARGATKYISSDGTDAEATDAETLASFDADGFTVGSDVQVNTNTEAYAAWCWAASAATLSGGSITPTAAVVSPAGFFSVATWTGTGLTGTVAHGLAVPPEVVIVKNMTDAVNWTVGSDYLNAGAWDYYMILDTAVVRQGPTGAVWNGAPTSTIWQPGSDNVVNGSGDSMVAYCFAPVPGICAIGSYVGTASATDGPYVSLGFRPRWLLIKGTTTATSWVVIDTERRTFNNDTDLSALYADLTTIESAASTDEVDLLADGFKPRGSGSECNQSGQTFLYIAIADIAGGGDLPPIYGR